MIRDAPNASNAEQSALVQATPSLLAHLLDPKEMNDRLNQARAYKREIDNLVNTTTDPLRKDKLRELANDTNTWIKTVEEMTARIDGFKSNTVVRQFPFSVPESVKRLTAQLASETDPRVKATIEKPWLPGPTSCSHYKNCKA